MYLEEGWLCMGPLGARVFMDYQPLVHSHIDSMLYLHFPGLIDTSKYSVHVTGNWISILIRVTLNSGVPGPVPTSIWFT